MRIGVGTVAMVALGVWANGASAEGRHRIRHAHHHHASHTYAYEERDFVSPPGTPGGGPVSGPLAAGVLSLGISGASAADGYGYGGYQRRQGYPQGYGFYGNGYYGPSYSYTGY